MGDVVHHSLYHLYNPKPNQKYKNSIELCKFNKRRNLNKKCLFFLVGTVVIIIIIANRPIKTNIENFDNDVWEYMFSTRIVCAITHLNVENSFIFWQPNDCKVCFCFTNEINIPSCFWPVVNGSTSINLFFYSNFGLLYFISMINA